MIRRILGPAAPQAAPAVEEDGTPVVTTAAAPEKPIPIPPNKTAKMIDMAQVQGQVQAQSLQKVGELADKNPNETVSIIRTWLHEDAA